MPQFKSVSYRHFQRWLVVLAAVIVYVQLGADVHTRRYPSYDIADLHYFQMHRNPALYFVMRWIFTELGGTAVVTTAAVLLMVCFVRSSRFKPDGVVTVLALGGGLGVMKGMKHLFPRPRAFHVDDHLGSSFPSGHVFFALTLYGLLVYWMTQGKSRAVRIWAWSVVLVIAFLVGVSRVYVGAHYPSDVVAGLALAIPWLYLWIAVLDHHRCKHISV